MGSEDNLKNKKTLNKMRKEILPMVILRSYDLVIIIFFIFVCMKYLANKVNLSLSSTFFTVPYFIFSSIFFFEAVLMRTDRLILKILQSNEHKDISN